MNPIVPRSAAVLLVLALVGAGAAAIAQEPAASSSATAPAFKARVLSNAELDTLLAKPQSVLILDVRRPDEIARIGGFPVYLNIQPGDISAHASAIPRDRTIVTVSNHAARAGRTADQLKELGFKVAGAVGAQTYEDQGGKLLHIAVPVPGPQ